VIWLGLRDWRWRYGCHYRSRLRLVDIEGEGLPLKVAVTDLDAPMVTVQVGRRRCRIAPAVWMDPAGALRQGHHRAAIVGDEQVARSRSAWGWPD